VKTRLAALAALGLSSLLFVASCATSDGGSSAPEARQPSQEEIAMDAYIYGYPLITMEMTRRISTNVAKPVGTRAPMGQFARLREYPTAKFRDVTAPNADTLYTVAWLDVGKEPWIVSVPAMKDRYYLLPLLDGWTNVFAAPGTRTTGGAAQKFAVTGPGFSGALPAGVTEYKSSTHIVWLIGRIYSTGTPADYTAVHALQDKLTAVPLSAYGKSYKPPAGAVDPKLDMKTAVREQVERLDAVAYFTLLAKLLETNPPAPEDADMVAQLAEIGIVPGQPFDASKLDPDVAAVVPKAAQEKITAWFKESVAAGDASDANGWLFTTKTGRYGTQYLQRALFTAIGLGANLPEDAIYPTSEVDSEGQRYEGSERYVMRFEKGALPPVQAFWSVTMYDAQYFFVANSLNRYNVSSRSKFKANPDGSIDVYIQNASPGKAKESNWLPAPKGPFVLMLRMYWPKETPPSILDGSWTPPPVVKTTPTPL
jgi:hypothetical protein